jgi:hypothetical protein
LIDDYNNYSKSNYNVNNYINDYTDNYTNEYTNNYTNEYNSDTDDQDNNYTNYSNTNYYLIIPFKIIHPIYHLIFKAKFKIKDNKYNYQNNDYQYQTSNNYSTSSTAYSQSFPKQLEHVFAEVIPLNPNNAFLSQQKEQVKRGEKTKEKLN